MKKILNFKINKMLYANLQNATNTARLLLEDGEEYEEVLWKVKNWLSGDLSEEVLEEISERVVYDAIRSRWN